MNRRRKIIIGVTTVTLAGGAFAISTGVSGAATNGMSQRCVTLNREVRETLDFMAAERAHRTGRTDAVLKNRQQVLDLIAQQRREAGCQGNVGLPAAHKTGKSGGGKSGATAQPTMAATTKPAMSATQPTAATTGGAGNSGAGNSGAGNSGAGQVVCQGDTVTLSGEEGTPPGATSGTFAVGTKLKVTNLDNNKSITVTVVGPSGSCVLLNNSAFNEIHEPNKFLIRRAVIEKVG